MLRWVFGIVVAAYGAMIVRGVQVAIRVPVLQPGGRPSGLPGVSVVVPARNEVDRIPALLEGLAQQTAAPNEVIVVDDGSTDGTDAAVRAHIGQCHGLRLLTGQDLPTGWAGKCWACWQGAGVATQPWLLFLDADTAPAPGMIAALLQHAVERGLDLVSVLPLLELGSWSERMLLPPFVDLAQAAFPLHLVNDPHSPVALANGQCLLIRRDVYLICDGHRAVKSSILEDTDLARAVKGRGYRLRIVAGPDLVKVRMYTNLGEIVEGLGKNASPGFQAGGWRSTVAGAREGWLAAGPFALIGIGGLLWRLGSRENAQATAVTGVTLWALITVFRGAMLSKAYRLNPAWSLLYPLGVVGYFAIAGRAWWRLQRGAGVTWKGRSYGVGEPAAG